MFILGRARAQPGHDHARHARRGVRGCGAVSPPPGMSIGELATATGVASGTLRMWETRHGFPEPMRQGGGDRRYTPEDAARVTQVLRERERGLSLAAAIERVRGWT